MDAMLPLQHLLRLVSRGNAVHAEVSRLSQRVPRCLRARAPAAAGSGASGAAAAGAPGGDGPAYDEILYDFRYFKASEYYEKLVEGSDALLELDDAFRESHLPFLERCYRLFESIVRYHADLLRWFEDLEAGIYIQYTVEGVAMDAEGKQLLCEAVAVFGGVLLLLDRLFGEDVRERIVVAYYRYKGASELANLDGVCSLCRRTGFLPPAADPASAAARQAPPAGYPEEFFARFALPAKLVNLVVSRLRSDDVYHQMAHFPAPEHRPAALAQQASCLYVALYFAPGVLHGEFSTMREIVDKHFVDTWVVLYGQGMWADLSVEWEGYRAAKAAIANIFTVPRLREVNAAYNEMLRGVAADLRALLKEGVLTRELLLDSAGHVLDTLRRANVALRWLTSHHSCLCTRRLQEVLSSSKPERGLLLNVLLDTAQLEDGVKALLGEILEGKAAAWADDRAGAERRLRELAEFYEGSKVLSREVKDLNLHRWFGHIANEVLSLDLGAAVASGRKIQQVITALEEVEQFHQIDASLQTKQYLADIRAHLRKMIRTVNVREEQQNTLTVVSDAAWLFSLIKSFIPGMHAKVRNDPFAVLKLQTLFLKMRSMMDLPLLRISQAGSSDLLSVSRHYSRELVGFVRDVLEVVPFSVFAVLTEIAELQKGRRLELPTRLEKEALRDAAQLDGRYRLAECTHRVAAFTHGILAMENTFIGVIELDPRQLLEDGIRKQLVHQISRTMYTALVGAESAAAPQRRRPSALGQSIFGGRRQRLGDLSLELQARLERLRAQLDGNRQSFEYIQDYINIPGLRVWMEELARVIGYNVEIECNRFLRRGVDDWRSDFQNADIPIPKFDRVDAGSATFMGRVVADVVRVTDPAQTMYLLPMSAWYTADGGEAMGIRQFSLLRRALDVPGLWGLDRILGFMIVHRARGLLDAVAAETVAEGGAAREASPLVAALRSVREHEEAQGAFPTPPLAWYATTVAQLEKMFAAPAVMDAVVAIGQYQLIRRQVASEIVSVGRIESSVFVDSLKILNGRLLSAAGSDGGQQQGGADGESVANIARFLEGAGMHAPLLTIFVTTDPMETLPLFLALLVIAHLGKYVYDPHLSTLALKSKSKSGGHDVLPIAVGVLTILKQFHFEYTLQVLREFGRYIKAAVEHHCGGGPGARARAASAAPPGSCPPEVVNLLVIVDVLCDLGGIPRAAAEMYIPAYLMDTAFDAAAAP